ncbi:MAG TPA: SagB family peptide dehydrogenase [Chloroflexota bacterium]|nr:SagB family peptide dehydrogenase [Chloroflexota bacterium]
MTNRETDRAWAYHNATKHSVASVRASRHVLDWPNQPLPYKIYTSLEPIRLPTEPPSWQALDRGALAWLCRHANGITKRVRWPGGTMPFRAAACTGALYHIELYLVCGQLADLEAGVYHYAAHDHSLRQLRRGDVREVLVQATGGEPSVSEAPVVLACTSTFWRNAWKYQARAYRHSFWDSGTVLANLFAVAVAHDLPAQLVLGFADAAVNRLLDVEPSREAAICLVSLGEGQAVTATASSVEPLGLPTERLSPHEVDYSEIVAMHAASSLDSGEEAVGWRAPGSDAAVPSWQSIDEVIRRRGSSRRFSHEPISSAQLSRLLEAAAQRVPSDFGGAGPLCQPYLIVNAVDGLASGTYVLAEGGLEPLRLGSFREQAGFLDLGQALAADAAVNVYALADLHLAFERFGNRGYRAAQLEGAIQGGLMYLTAYAQGLGATGLTFFDDDVTAFFSPHAADKSVMFLTAIGHPAKRATGFPR